MDDSFFQQSQHMADLLVFVKVVETSGFTAAATALGLGKSAVSKQIQRLERNLGVTLLHRTTRRMTVTEAGRVLYEHGATMVRAMEDASASLSSLASRPSGRLKMTASVSYGKHVLGPLLPEFHRRGPWRGDPSMPLILCCVPPRVSCAASGCLTPSSWRVCRACPSG
jgi:DNA-binding transcriptional LysR family regulator